MRKAFPILAVLLALTVSVTGAVTAVRIYLARRAYQTALNEYYKDLEAKKPFRDATVPRLERAVRLAPGDPDPHFLLGRIRGRSGKPEEARAHMAESLRVFPLNGRGHYYLGFAHHYLGKRAAAVESMETAAALAANNPDLQYNVGYFFWFNWERMGRVTELERAFKYFRAAADRDGAYLNKILHVIEKYAFPYHNLVKIIPDNPDGHWRAGHYLGHRRGNWEPALEELVKAGTALENQSGFLFDRGLALLFTKAEPRPDFRRAISLSKDKNKTIRRLSFYFVATRRHAEALAFWKELEEDNPHLPGPVVNRAEAAFNAVRESLREPMHALTRERAEALKRARSSNERKQMEEHYFTKGKNLWQEACRELEAYLKEKLSMFEEDPELWKLMGEMYKQQARYDEAELAFRHAADVGGAAVFWKTLIQFHIGMKEYTKAWKAAIKAKGIHPEDHDIAVLAERTRDLMLAGGKEKNR